MKTVLIIWGIGLILCAIEAYFYTEIDPESKRFLKEREKNRKNEYKSTD